MSPAPCGYTRSSTAHSPVCWCVPPRCGFGCRAGRAARLSSALAAYRLAASLVNAIRFTPRVEFFTFLNQWGWPAFSIVRAKRQAAECDAFILTLVAAIELAHSEMPEADRKDALRPLLDELQSSAVAPGDIPQWRLSLATGLAAVLLPILPGVIVAWGDLLFFIEFPLCVVAMAFGLLAIWNREPRCWWGLLGVALGLVPLFFY